MKKPVLALMAHNLRNYEMVQMVRAHKDMLSHMRLVATECTGRLIEEMTDLDVDTVGNGPMLGALISRGAASAVVFLRDPQNALASEPDLTALLRICDANNVPVATNLATAEAVLQLIMTAESEIEKVLSQKENYLASVRNKTRKAINTTSA